MTRATVITDASFCPRTHAAGWAAWVRVDGRREPIRRSGTFRDPVSSSRRAEMLAAVNGIWIAAQFGATDILLQTDCLAVAHMANGETRQNRLIEEWTAAINAAGVALIQMQGRHVKGHTTVDDARSFVNRWCDEHAKTAMRQARKSINRRAVA